MRRSWPSTTAPSRYENARREPIVEHRPRRVEILVVMGRVEQEILGVMEQQHVDRLHPEAIDARVS